MSTDSIGSSITVITLTFTWLNQINITTSLIKNSITFAIPQKDPLRCTCYIVKTCSLYFLQHRFKNLICFSACDKKVPFLAAWTSEKLDHPNCLMEFLDSHKEAGLNLQLLNVVQTQFQVNSEEVLFLKIMRAFPFFSKGFDNKLKAYLKPISLKLSTNECCICTYDRHTFFVFS